MQYVLRRPVAVAIILTCILLIPALDHLLFRLVAAAVMIFAAYRLGWIDRGVQRKEKRDESVLSGIVTGCNQFCADHGISDSLRHSLVIHVLEQVTADIAVDQTQDTPEFSPRYPSSHGSQVRS